MSAGDASPTVHLLCGLNGAGKTTYARRLAQSRRAVRFTLDEWMLRLDPELRYDAPGYGARAERAKLLIWDVALQILALGRDVILDWNSWSRERRAVWKDRVQAAGYGVFLHHIRVPVEVAVVRAEGRTGDGSHDLDAAAVRHLSTILEEPTADEGLEIVSVDASRSDE